MFENVNIKTVKNLKKQFKQYEEVIRDLISKKNKSKMYPVIKLGQIKEGLIYNKKKHHEFDDLKYLNQKKENLNNKQIIFKKIKKELLLIFKVFLSFWIITTVFQTMALNSFNYIEGILSFIFKYFVKVSTIMVPSILAYATAKVFIKTAYDNKVIEKQIIILEKRFQEIENNEKTPIELQKQEYNDQIKRINTEIFELQKLLEEIGKVLEILDKMDEKSKVDTTQFVTSDMANALVQLDTYQRLAHKSQIENSGKKRRFTRF